MSEKHSAAGWSVTDHDSSRRPRAALLSPQTNTLRRLPRQNPWSVCFLRLVLIVSCATASADRFEVLVWADGSLEKEYPEGSVFPGGCGPVMLRSVSDLRELPDSEFESLDRVREISREGELLATWRKPINAPVFGIAGDWLAVGAPQHRMMINTAGEIRREDPDETFGQGDGLKMCGDDVLEALPFEAKRSAYLRCAVLPDLKSGGKRRLAYDGPCT